MNIKEKSLNFLSRVKAPLMASGAVVGACVPAFAEAPAGFTITSDMVSPIVTAISSGLTTLVPIGITIMAAMIGISLIPRIIYKFL